ncbi:unnamed protein product [Symbiodinium natans]|uniref:Uncharacterized protein n=1 Tax=Symbiodinium natans TaxID=878477 RepID=A0A812QSY5_9DINO|nr:unnamed protein product [Symbiodinium natans]
MEVVPGLTDRRFVGVMYLWFEDKGFGFIECPDITKKFGQDAFLHRTQRKNFKRGQYDACLRCAQSHVATGVGDRCISGLVWLGFHRLSAFGSLPSEDPRRS